MRVRALDLVNDRRLHPIGERHTVGGQPLRSGKRNISDLSLGSPCIGSRLSKVGQLHNFDHGMLVPSIKEIPFIS